MDEGGEKVGGEKKNDGGGTESDVGKVAGSADPAVTPTSEAGGTGAFDFRDIHEHPPQDKQVVVIVNDPTWDIGRVYFNEFEGDRGEGGGGGGAADGGDGPAAASANDVMNALFDSSDHDFGKDTFNASKNAEQFGDPVVSASGKKSSEQVEGGVTQDGKDQVVKDGSEKNESFGVAPVDQQGFGKMDDDFGSNMCGFLDPLGWPKEQLDADAADADADAAGDDDSSGCLWNRQRDTSDGDGDYYGIHRDNDSENLLGKGDSDFILQGTVDDGGVKGMMEGLAIAGTGHQKEKPDSGKVDMDEIRVEEGEGGDGEVEVISKQDRIQMYAVVMPDEESSVEEQEDDDDDENDDEDEHPNYVSQAEQLGDDDDDDGLGGSSSNFASFPMDTAVQETMSASEIPSFDAAVEVARKASMDDDEGGGVDYGKVPFQDVKEGDSVTNPAEQGKDSSAPLAFGGSGISAIPSGETTFAPAATTTNKSTKAIPLLRPPPEEKLKKWEETKMRGKRHVDASKKG